MKSVEANEAGETMRVKLAAAEAEVERLRAALDLAGDLSKVEARAEQAEAERDTLRAELLCRDALIKDHLARILHLENRVDAEAHRAEKAEAALRVMINATVRMATGLYLSVNENQWPEWVVRDLARAHAVLRDTAPREEKP